MKGRAIKPLALLVSVMALGLSATQPVLAAEAQYQVGHTFSDSLDTTVRLCTNSRCDIGGGFDRSSDTGFPHELPHLSGSTSNPGGGGGWAKQQDTLPGSDKDYGASLDYSTILADSSGNSGSGGSCSTCLPKRAMTLDELDASVSDGGWANQQETIRLSAAQPNGNSASGGGWANQQDTLPGSDKDYGESLDYSTVLAASSGTTGGKESCSTCLQKRAMTLDELDASVSDGGWAGQPVEQSWLESNALSRAVRPCTNNQCSDDLPA